MKIPKTLTISKNLEKLQNMATCKNWRNVAYLVPTPLYNFIENIAIFTTLIEGDAMQKARVHFENNSPFLVAERVEREIEISHWGNIAITDKIWVKHNGASLKE